MNIQTTKLFGVFVIENFHIEDERGSFIKTYHKEKFSNNKLCNCYEESYFSISKKNVIRGMHFQIPPYEHEKLVYVANGAVIDVVLDLRSKSSTFGQSIVIPLSADTHRSIYIPKGLAHGFKAIEDNTIMVYNVSTVYNKTADSGIRYDSFGLDWNIDSPIISMRDQSFVTFGTFAETNPF